MQAIASALIGAASGGLAVWLLTRNSKSSSSNEDKIHGTLLSVLTIKEAIIFLNDNLVVTSANNAFLSLTGFERTDIIGKRVNSIFKEEVRALNESILTKSTHNATRLHVQSLTAFCTNGETIRVSTSTSYDSKTKRYCMSVADLTPQFRNEQLHNEKEKAQFDLEILQSKMKKKSSCNSVTGSDVSTMPSYQDMRKGLTEAYSDPEIDNLKRSRSRVHIPLGYATTLASDDSEVELKKLRAQAARVLQSDTTDRKTSHNLTHRVIPLRACSLDSTLIREYKYVRI